MPNYRYECENTACELSTGFNFFQSMHDNPLAKCLYCGHNVYRVIEAVNLNIPTGDSDLKSRGFAKLVRRDKGVYENVTALDHESKYYHADRPETLPDLSARITD